AHIGDAVALQKRGIPVLFGHEAQDLVAALAHAPDDMVKLVYPRRVSEADHGLHCLSSSPARSISILRTRYCTSSRSFRLSLIRSACTPATITCTTIIISAAHRMRDWMCPL